jgi:hypothetical protein
MIDHPLHYSDGWKSVQMFCAYHHGFPAVVRGSSGPLETTSTLASGTAQQQRPSERSTACNCTCSIIVRGTVGYMRDQREIAGRSIVECEAYL